METTSIKTDETTHIKRRVSSSYANAILTNLKFNELIAGDRTHKALYLESGRSKLVNLKLSPHYPIFKLTNLE